MIIVSDGTQPCRDSKKSKKGCSASSNPCESIVNLSEQALASLRDCSRGGAQNRSDNTTKQQLSLPSGAFEF